MKKKICVFTIDDDSSCASESLENDLAMIVDYLYDELLVLEENKNIDIIDKSSKKLHNEILVNEFNGKYRLEYMNDRLLDNTLKNTFYDPFILDNHGFALTIIDNSISDMELINLINSIQCILGFNYSFSISSISYNAKNMDDERSRNMAIYKMFVLSKLKDNAFIHQNTRRR